MTLFKNKKSRQDKSVTVKASPTVTTSTAAASPEEVFGKRYNDLSGAKADAAADKVGVYGAQYVS
jgi:hypothetical protein